MAKQKYSPNEIASMNDDWGKDVNDKELRGFSGEAVQKFIKAQLNGKVGKLAYDETNNRYMMFASDDTYNEYKEDPTKTGLVLGTFDAPFNYTASINFSTPVYNAVSLGSKGNYIDFTFDIVNKAGQSTGEGVTCTYTVMQGSTKKVYNDIYRYGQSVHKNIDEWLREGTNTIIVSIVGDTSLAGTTANVVYQVVNLSLTDEYDISTVANIQSGKNIVEVPVSVSGYGTKILEWYVDGELLPFVKDEDEIVETSATRTKYIDCYNLSQGVHSIQFRAYTAVNGEKFYTDTHYREVMVFTNADVNPLVAVACIIPNDKGVVNGDNPLKLYGIEQFVPYDLTFATYSPKNVARLNAEIKLDDALVSSVSSSNGVVNEVSIICTTSGDKSLSISVDGATREIPVEVNASSTSIKEITAGLELAFDGIGRTNNSPDKDKFTYGSYTGTFTGFGWNNTSGWVDNALKLNAGNSFDIDIAPLQADAMATGKTLEFAFRTSSVFDDDAVICNLLTDGVGINITASEISVTSENGKTIGTKYNSEEYIRLSVVINRRTGATNKCLMFVYVNGVISAAVNVLESDYIRSGATLRFTATEAAKIDLRQIRIYNAALTSDQILNNYILYKDDVNDMTRAYERNDIMDDNGVSISPDRLTSQCPVMIITGDIPTLENTSNKKEQVIVDVQYINAQDPTRSFTMKDAAITPQGTSSMSYPKKNFKLYTKRIDTTKVYDYAGKEIEDKLYAFKTGAQPVGTWCLKADYAESSGTHNTGIARLWNKVMYDARIDGEYKLRTLAQGKALEANYPYDVRTTVDGFPINLFYRLDDKSDLVYIGKYNFNNDKSTESVFGFRDIPGFDNSNMECWEVLNNGDPIALFNTVDDFDDKWSEAFEARYPDGSTEVGHLKAFCEWMVGMKGNPDAFATEKWNHLDVHKVAAYYVYLMRFAAVDQTVKNAMLTTEDGEHYFFINYDNDTINGVINTGALAAPYDTDRNTIGSDGSYIFAGHESSLWNMLEADSEFMEVVRKVDAALFVAGLKYADVIDMFDVQQAGKWCERVYNQDAQYKYVGPYVNSGINNLFMLQGSRSAHRKWWLKKRFDLFDSMFVSGDYKNKVIEFKMTNDTPAGQQFSIVAGSKLYYGYGINELVTESGIKLDVDDAYEFSTPRVLNLGDPVRVYAANNLKKLDVSKCVSRINQLSLVAGSGTLDRLEELVIGGDASNNNITEISGLRSAVNLTLLDIRNCTAMTGMSLAGLARLRTFNAGGSGLTSVEFERGSDIASVTLPNTVQTLTFESLPNLTASGLHVASYANVHTLRIVDCPNLTKSMDLVNTWYSNKTVDNSRCNLTLTDINWTNVDATQLIRLGDIKSAGGTLSLKGKIYLSSVTDEQVNQLVEIFGSNCFDSNSELWISAPSSIFISGKTTIKETESTTLIPVVFTQKEGSIRTTVSGLASGDKWDADTYTLTTTERKSSRTITITFLFTSNDASEVARKEVRIAVKPLVYVTGGTISESIISSSEKKYTFTPNITEYDRLTINSWTLDSTLTAAGISITKQEGNYCVVTYDSSNISETVDGSITVSFNTSTARLAIQFANDNIAFTSKEQSSIVSALYNKGLIQHSNYITKAEAASIQDADLVGRWFLFIAGDRMNNINCFSGLSLAYISVTGKQTVILELGDNFKTVRLFCSRGYATNINVKGDCLNKVYDDYGYCDNFNITIQTKVEILDLALYKAKVEIKDDFLKEITISESVSTSGSISSNVVPASLKISVKDCIINFRIKYPASLVFENLDTPNTIEYRGNKFHVVDIDGIKTICAVAKLDKDTKTVALPDDISYVKGISRIPLSYSDANRIICLDDYGQIYITGLYVDGDNDDTMFFNKDHFPKHSPKEFIVYYGDSFTFKGVISMKVQASTSTAIIDSDITISGGEIICRDSNYKRLIYKHKSIGDFNISFTQEHYLKEIFVYDENFLKIFANFGFKFYSSDTYCTGMKVDSSITKTLYIPAGTTLPSSSTLKTQLVDKCGFVVSATL